jgi:hypothetical protein
VSLLNLLVPLIGMIKSLARLLRLSVLFVSVSGSLSFTSLYYILLSPGPLALLEFLLNPKPCIALPFLSLSVCLVRL